MRATFLGKSWGICLLVLTIHLHFLLALVCRQLGPFAGTLSLSLVQYGSTYLLAPAEAVLLSTRLSARALHCTPEQRYCICVHSIHTVLVCQNPPLFPGLSNIDRLPRAFYLSPSLPEDH
jgi:hypothetical protein